MALTFTRASSKYLDVASASVTAVPLTMACWFYPTNHTNFQTLMSLNNIGTTFNNFRFDFRGDGSGIVRAATLAGGGASEASSSAGAGGVSAWYHGAAVFSAANSRVAYFNGGNSGSETTSRTPTGINNTKIGAYKLGTNPVEAFFDGYLAECAIWNAALDAAEIAALAKGYSPLLIRTASLVHYIPGLVDIIDRKGTSWTNNNSVGFTTHPRVIMPRRRAIAYGVAPTSINIQAAQIIDNLSQSVTLNCQIQITVAQTLGDFSQSTTVIYAHKINAAQTLANFTQSVAVNVGNAISAAQTLANLTQSTAVNVGNSLSAAQTLAALTQAANVVFTPDEAETDFFLNAAQTLADFTQVAQINVGNNISVAQLLDALIQSASINASPAIRVAQTIGPLAQSVVITFTGLPTIDESEIRDNVIKIDPRLPSPNQEYERRWLGDNMLEVQRRLRMATFTLDLQTDTVQTVASLLAQPLYRAVLPADFFVQAGQVLRITAKGTLANNANNKTLRIKFGATTILTAGTVSGNNKHWTLEATITCVDDVNQKYSGEGRFNQELPFISDGASTEDATDEITIEITGQSATVAVAEVTLQFVELQHAVRN